MDDFQQGLVPGGSEPRNVDYNKYLAMPRKPSLLDMMRQEIEDSDEVPSKSRIRYRRTSGDSTRGGCAHAFHPVPRPAYAQCATWTYFVTAAPMLIVGSTDPKDSKAHGYTLHASDRDSYPTNIACARTRHGPSVGARHPFSDPETRKKPRSWQVARPTDGKPWRGNQEHRPRALRGRLDLITQISNSA